jgi:hypothetical protein
VYKQDYKTQVMHHATAAYLDEVFFVVANENWPIYSVMITFTAKQRQTFLGILMDIYDRSLSWAYTDAWQNVDPADYIPDFWEDVISRSSYHINQDTVVFQYVLWKALLKVSVDVGMPLPVAKQIVLAIVAIRNKGNGRIDEMSHYMKDLLCFLAKESSRQFLISSEVKKVAVNAFLLKKHCYNSIPNKWL